MESYEITIQKIKERFNKTAVFADHAEILAFLKALSSDFDSGEKVLLPNLSLGEISLCVENYIGYTATKDVAHVIGADPDASAIIEADFLQENFNQKYKSILLFPPMGVRTAQKQSEVLYLKKCLELLDEQGRLIALTSQSILSVPAYRSIREKIIQNFSLEAVFHVGRISSQTATEFCIVILDHKIQSEQIYMTNGGNLTTLYSDYKNGIHGFWVHATEVYNRMDPHYFEPEYQKARELIRNRDTMKLSSVASIYRGADIPSQERKQTGDYLVIKPQHIYDNRVHCKSQGNVYCDQTFVSNKKHCAHSVLKKGDILISLVGQIHWAIYHGEEDFAIANQHVAIIRGRADMQEWISFFFRTKTGIAYLEDQLKLFCHFGVYNHISVKSLSEIVIPDKKLIELTDHIMRAGDFEAKVAEMFRFRGWDVREGYENESNHFYYDLALFDHGVLKGVVDVKPYQSKHLEKQPQILHQLARLKESTGGAKVFLFVDNYIFEYKDQRIVPLPGTPEPGIEVQSDYDKSCETAAHCNLSAEIKRLKEEMAVSVAHSFEMEQLMCEISNLKNQISNVDNKMSNMSNTMSDMSNTMSDMNDTMSDIKSQLDKIAEQITGYQSLVEKQLDLAVTPEEQERILHAFSEECIERIVNEVQLNHRVQEYRQEEEKLILLFKEEAWNKLDASSQNFLVSSKMTFQNFMLLKDRTDYSGVCLLVTKALEVEMSRRFCIDFIAYLEEQYPGNYSKFPTTLLPKDKKKNLQPIDPTHFTLGSVAYVLCKYRSSKSKEEQANNKARLLEFSKKKLFSGKTEDEIFDLLSEYAEAIEKVRKNYRNPAAHTNQLTRIDAEQCFELVIDVEKLLKRMLDSFDY